MNSYKDFKGRDGVFRSARFQSMVRGGGKLVKYTTPHRHEFHPVERYIRTVTDKSRSMLADSKLASPFFLPFALETAVVLHNITPRDGTTPHQLRYGGKPDASRVRVFGCKALVHNPPSHPKHRPRAREAILLSFGMNSFSHGTYKLWDLKARKVVYCRDVTFFKDKNDVPGEEGDSDSDDEGTETNNGQTKRPSPRIADPFCDSSYVQTKFQRENELAGPPNTPTWISEALAVSREEGKRTAEESPETAVFGSRTESRRRSMRGGSRAWKQKQKRSTQKEPIQG